MANLDHIFTTTLAAWSLSLSPVLSAVTSKPDPSQSPEKTEQKILPSVDSSVPARFLLSSATNFKLPLIQYATESHFSSSLSQKQNPSWFPFQPWHLGRNGMTTREFGRPLNYPLSNPLYMRILPARNLTRSAVGFWFDEIELKNHPKGVLPPVLLQKENKPAPHENKLSPFASYEA